MAVPSSSVYVSVPAAASCVISVIVSFKSYEVPSGSVIVATLFPVIKSTTAKPSTYNLFAASLALIGIPRLVIRLDPISKFPVIVSPEIFTYRGSYKAELKGSISTQLVVSLSYI